MLRKLFIAALALAACAGSMSAQARKGLRINEVMVENQTSVVDEYGNRSAWIELFNSNFAPLEISSVYITTDPNNKTMSRIPLGDQRTKMGKRQHLLLWADGDHTLGTFHTDIKLQPGKANWIGIYDADGLTLIDSITVPPMAADASYALTKDGGQEWDIRTPSAETLYISPGSSNAIRKVNPKVANFKENDSAGLGMTVTAMGIVFSALLLLSICFWVIGKINTARSKRKKMLAQGLNPVDVPLEERPSEDSGEEIAAIALALYQHLNAHDQESNALTINKVRRAYSPWNSRIYQMRQTPQRLPRR